MLADHEVSSMAEDDLVQIRRRTVAFIFQAFGLLPILTAAENVEIPLRLVATEPRCTDSSTRTAPGSGRPHELSGGEQQRVAIARALANRPPVLLADEPTGQLDSETGRMIMRLLRSIVRSESITAIVATHDPAILEVADRVVELRDGVLVDPESAAD